MFPRSTISRDWIGGDDRHEDGSHGTKLSGLIVRIADAL
jgi:hypothetical protein